MVILKSEKEIQYMKDAGKIVAGALKEVGKSVASGVSTLELDTIADDYILKKGALPAFKGYRGFPASSCISVNEEVVHGIPSQRKLKSGDIVGVDIGVKLNDYHGDAAYTFSVDKPLNSKVEKLLTVAEQSLNEAIKCAQVGNRLGDIGSAVQTLAEKNGFNVVRDLVGHGIGRCLHEPPEVPNYGVKGKGMRLRKGMTIAIEPMVNIGTYELKTLKDGWTVITADKSYSAHYEHTVALTEDGPEILTKL